MIAYILRKMALVVHPHVILVQRFSFLDNLSVSKISINPPTVAFLNNPTEFQNLLCSFVRKNRMFQENSEM